MCHACRARAGRNASCLICTPHAPPPPAPPPPAPPPPAPPPPACCVAALVHLTSLAGAVLMTVGGLAGLAYAGKAGIWLTLRATGSQDPSWFTWAPQRILMIDIIVGGVVLCGASLCGGVCCRVMTHQGGV